MKLTDYLNGDRIHVRYTCMEDDITRGRKPAGMPYLDRRADFDGSGYSVETDSHIQVLPFGEGLKILLDTGRRDLSEFGISIPVNFMGKKNGGGWENQYLLNSVYTSRHNVYKYCYLSNPKGKNLILFPKGRCDGWKADYSSEFSPGHFFLNLVFFASFDRAYGTGGGNHRLELYLFEVPDFNSAADIMANILDSCMLTYERSGGKVGAEIICHVHGECDEVRCGGKTYYPADGHSVKILVSHPMLHEAVPYKRGARGMEAVIYGYEDIDKLWEKSMDAVTEKELRATDGNLCEHQCWEAAMLRYMQKHGRRESYEEQLKKALAVIMEKEEDKAVLRRTIYWKEHGNHPAWWIFESERIQELLFGVTILTDAWKLWGLDEYAEYALNSLDHVLRYHFDKGMIYTSFLNGDREDYTTVCCLAIPFVDAALAFADYAPEAAERFRRAAGQIAEYILTRKNFHTEAVISGETEQEMEDGSISCSALTLLYYCAKIDRDERMVRRAKEILDMHEAWVTHTPIAPAFHSSLRWWETFWEGDANGPSICYGHAWTIWRAEADYWYYTLTGDARYREKAFNGFMSNLSKIDGNGSSYACYMLDYIPGGGFTDDSAQVDFSIRQGFPHQRDSGLSRYVWVRAFESVLNGGVF